MVSTPRSVALGLLVLALVLGAGCRKPDLSTAKVSLRFEPEVLNFGNIYADGDVHVRTLSVVNEGRATLSSVEWQGNPGPFTADWPVSLPPGETVVTVRVSLAATGPVTRVLGVKGVEPTITLSVTGLALPPCVPSGPCVTSKFNTVAGTCDETPVSDGAPCQADSACIVNAQCLVGRCIGQERACDDGNACTVDVCNSTTGCEFLPRPPCPGDGKCLIGACNPATGCEMVPAEDGTTCGPKQTCIEAQVCITGECTIRNPPDGYVCAEASPCQGEGRCVGNDCVRSSPVTTLSPTWRYDSLPVDPADAGSGDTKLHDFVMEPNGAMTLSSFFSAPAKLRANTAEPHDAPLGNSRRCIIWGTRLVCADYPAAPNGRVTAMDLATGASQWSFDIRVGKPDFVQQTSTMFLARLVVQASDRLAALFEAYPLHGVNSQCRSYFLVVLNAQGQLVTATPVVDPLIDVCNHPHPYGAASDAVGNLFLAFSPTLSQQAPLKPGKPTLLLSYTRDGIFRWKVTDSSFEGGELAVARGLLYPENGEVVRTAATGEPAFAVPQTLGRIVVSDSRFLAAPVTGQTTLMGYEAGQPSLSWSHQLAGSTRFWSDQLRLAGWQTSRGTETVALTFTQDATTAEAWLHAIRVHDGSEAFNCPVNFGPGARTPPQLFEIANGSMGVMAGALDDSGQPGCNKCDPPFAASSAAFFSVPLPSIVVPRAPWVGTFGGATHDHREEVDPALPGNASN